MRTPFGGHWAVRRGPLKSLPTALGRLPTMVVVACVVAACGNSGGIAGTVNEIEGGPLPGVRVTIDGLKTHREATTDTDGRFVFQNLAAGGYTLKTDLADYVGDMKAVTVSGGAGVGSSEQHGTSSGHAGHGTPMTVTSPTDTYNERFTVGTR